MGDKGSGSFFRSFLESGLGRCIASLVEEVKSDSRLVAEDMRSFSGGIRSDISGLCGKLGGKVGLAKKDGVAGDLGKGALRDYADARGDDIRRAAGIAAENAEPEVTPEEVAADLVELADDLGEGASSLKDNADAHGDDIRRAAGIAADRKEAE